MRADAGPVLALDTATNTVVVAVTASDGSVVHESFRGRYHHSQELLPAVVRVLDRAGLRLADLRAIVVGTGPGAFTGLRVGIATAKTLAHELGIAITGVPTSDALLRALPGATEAWLPGGPRDRVVVRSGADPVVVPDASPGPKEGVVAVDLEGRAPAAALELGRRAVDALPGELLRLGEARLQQSGPDALDAVVPRYAIRPRGAPAEETAEGVAWSRDPR